MAPVSCGLLMLKSGTPSLEVFLVHPGGPYFKNKDLGYWTIPKGLSEAHEPLLDAAIREFREETGILPKAPFFNLGSIKQKSGKVVYAWAFVGTWELGQGINSNSFTIEWPPRSGKTQEFPEIDNASWFTVTEAQKKLMTAQIPFLLRALELKL